MSDPHPRFTEALRALCDRVQVETGYRPHQLRQMIENRGSGHSAATALLSKSQVSYGFEGLMTTYHRPDLTVEASILDAPDWSALFPDDLLKVAKRRLDWR